jgi:hypothetical protein
VRRVEVSADVESAISVGTTGSVATGRAVVGGGSAGAGCGRDHRYHCHEQTRRDSLRTDKPREPDADPLGRRNLDKFGEYRDRKDQPGDPANDRDQTDQDDAVVRREQSMPDSRPADARRHRVAAERH